MSVMYSFRWNFGLTCVAPVSVLYSFRLSFGLTCVSPVSVIYTHLGGILG